MLQGQVDQQMRWLRSRDSGPVCGKTRIRIMKILFTKETYRAIQAAGAKSPVFHDEEVWRDYDIDSAFIAPMDRTLIKKLLREPELWQFIESRRAVRAIENVEMVESKDAGAIKIKKLKLFHEVVRDLIGKTPHKYVFYKVQKFGRFLPFFVDQVEHHPAGQFTQENVSISMSALHRGKNGGEDDAGAASDTQSFGRKDLRGDTAQVILERKGILLETPALMAEYEEDLKKYQEISPRTGAQYLASGHAMEITVDEDGDERDGEIVPMMHDGHPEKTVIDDREDFGGDAAFMSCDFWSKKKSSDESGNATLVDGVIHVTELTEYVYDPMIGSKIVLSPENVKLIDALVVGTVKRMDDVIRGKAQGIIVLCTGTPGTGKTLTAEVYSEVAKRPLYTVQCSQLGTDSGSLEKSLQTVLDRANRWGAILLLDEADVYIHERGEDVEQNAIVGVFLRLLEYFNGILFMNTNRQEVVDDAIISRVTAHVKYQNPSPHDASRIWEILFSQYGVSYDSKLLAECVSSWIGISGRNIRQIVRLGKMMADHAGHVPRLDDFKFAAQFQDLVS